MRDRQLEAFLQNTLDSGNKVWIVGDIHGYKETLDSLIGNLNLGLEDIVFCLGDMVDRGPDSVGVVDLFMGEDNLYSLKGNHEQMLLMDWFKNDGFGNYSDTGFWSTIEPLSREKMQRIRKFISSLPTEIVLEKFRLVHAGYSDMPYSINLEQQTDNERLWSRDIFTVNYPFDPERTIIVGHTVIQNYGIIDDEEVWISKKLLGDGRPSAIGIDTGVFLLREENPRISAFELGSGKVVSQKRVEVK